MKALIVVIGYNRIASLKRLFDSIISAYFPNDSIIDLFVSLDYSDLQEKIFKELYSTDWNYGTFKIIKHKSRLGLKKHVIYCGNLSKDYDFVIMLEDDLTVSKTFFSFALESIKYYLNFDKIAGISLYSHKKNPLNLIPFTPIFNGSDTFLLQYAQSWGQVFTKNMWKKFHDFYVLNLNFDFINSSLPTNIKNWSEKSWLKFYMAYIYVKDLYFVYPYNSFSTNHSEKGEHNIDSNSLFMVPLENKSRNFIFHSLTDHILYDIFFENHPSFLSDSNLNIDEITIDIYGTKPNSLYKRYLYTTELLSFKILKGFKIKYKPHEINLNNFELGNDIFLYDTNKKSKRRMFSIRSLNHKFLYYYGIKVNFYIIFKSFLKYLFPDVSSK